MPQVPDSQNSILHTDDRVVIVVTIASGVQFTVSLSDEDVEKIYQKRQEIKAGAPKNNNILALPPGVIPPRLN